MAVVHVLFAAALLPFLAVIHFNLQLLDYVEIIDDIVVDLCPLYNKFEDKYNQKFIAE